MKEKKNLKPNLDRKQCRALADIFRDMRKGASRLDDHPLARKDFCYALIEDINDAKRPKLNNYPGRGLLFETLQLIVWVRLQDAFRSGNPQEIAGPLLVWMTYIIPIARDATPVSVENARLRCENENELPGMLADEVLMRREKQDKKLLNGLAAYFGGIGRVTGNVRRLDCMGKIVEHIRATAKRLNLKLDPNLRLRKTRSSVEGSKRKCIKKKTSKRTSSPQNAKTKLAVQTGTTESNSALDTSVGISTKQGERDQSLANLCDHINQAFNLLPSAIDVKVPSGSFVPRLVRLSDKNNEMDCSVLCAEPRQGTVLLGEPGSGKTSVLYWLMQNESACLPIYLDARDFAKASEGVSKYMYVAKKVCGTGWEGEEKRQTFQAWLQGKDRQSLVVWLVDNLDHPAMNVTEQKRIVRNLQHPETRIVYTATKGREKNIIRQVIQGEVVCYELVQLDENKIANLTLLYRDLDDVSLDLTLAQRVCCEMPELASLPLGLFAILRQVSERQSDCASVMIRFIETLYQRRDLTALNWDIKANAIVVAALGKFAGIGYSWSKRPERSIPYGFFVPPSDSKLLEMLHSSPLVVPTEKENDWQFFNRQIYAFFVAISQGATEMRIPVQYPYENVDDQLIERYRLALYSKGWRLNESLWWKSLHSPSPARV